MNRKTISLTVLFAALGYFVDIYDLILFSVVRIPSLRSLGVPESQLMSQGVFLLNMQMGGMLIGGLLWGILGDKRGRLSVMFGSIFLYSVANIMNCFVTTVDAYGLLRFLAGVGLAGELGAAITLVSEIMSKETRGWGTTVVAAIGLLGAVVAGAVGELTSWKVAYLVGGLLGLALLVARMQLFESGMFEEMKKAQTSRGDFFLLFRTRKRFLTYLACILIGLPCWFSLGILVSFSPEFGKAFGIPQAISAGRAVAIFYIGISAGDIVSGGLSQWMRSRMRALAIFLGLTFLLNLAFLFLPLHSDAALYWVCLFMGFGNGYWALFVTNAAEQFGTNLRATVTTTVPNFVRGAVVPLTLGFQFLKPSLGLVGSALAIGVVCIALSLRSVFFLEDPFGKDLGYTEA